MLPAHTNLKPDSEDIGRIITKLPSKRQENPCVREKAPVMGQNLYLERDEFFDNRPAKHGVLLGSVAGSKCTEKNAKIALWRAGSLRDIRDRYGVPNVSR